MRRDWGSEGLGRGKAVTSRLRQRPRHQGKSDMKTRHILFYSYTMCKVNNQVVSQASNPFTTASISWHSNLSPNQAWCGLKTVLRDLKYALQELKRVCRCWCQQGIKEGAERLRQIFRDWAETKSLRPSQDQCRHLETEARLRQSTSEVKTWVRQSKICLENYVDG